MNILVTRPEPDAMKLVGLLQQRGHAGLAAPLSTFVPLPLEPEALEGVTALIATSRNALRALVGSDALPVARALTVFAVGNATAEEARRMGFARVIKGPGTAADLVPLIVSLVDPAEEILLHIAGDRLAFDLVGELAESGIRVDSRTVYRMDAATRLPVNVVGAIASGVVDAVLLMSPRAARIWVRLVGLHGLAGPARDLWHFCLSEAVARQLASLGPGRVEIAGKPTLEELLALVQRTTASWDE